MSFGWLDTTTIFDYFNTMKPSNIREQWMNRWFHGLDFLDIICKDGALQKHFLECEFDGECDHCDNPIGKTWATYTGYPVCEYDYYCTKCAVDMLKDCARFDV